MRKTLRNPFSARVSVAFFALLLSLAGCQNTGGGATAAESVPGAPRAGSSTSVNRDVERPDVFHVTEKALWDGRPSLGGVWVAYPANIDPERVIIRNGSNGKSVVGALFRRERDNPGPKIQLSSDAAVALGVVAGTPTEISIVVLRREEIVVNVPEAAVVNAPEAAVAVSDTSMTIPPRRAVLADVPAVVPPEVGAPPADSAAIVEETLGNVSAADQSVEAPVDGAAGSHWLAGIFRITKPYIQVSTFTEEAGANGLVEALMAAGVQAQAQSDNPNAPTLWRVVSGPYKTRSERTAQLRIIKGLGYTEAFFFK